MTEQRDIRADYDRDSIVVYQAYNDAIADAALAAGRFVPPFSTTRMTWIKPSFLWLMARSNWAQKSGQQRVLGVRLTRRGFDAALSLGVLTSFEPRAHGDQADYEAAFEAAEVHIQWDPERSLRGAKLNHRSIQIGVSRYRIQEFFEDWCVALTDETPRVRKIHRLLSKGRANVANRHLPAERAYPVEAVVRRRLGMD
ncbi:MAG: DUF4291 domain-containing protein [Myxococcota bacterium]